MWNLTSTTRPKSLHRPILEVFKPVLFLLTIMGVDIHTSPTLQPSVTRRKNLLLSKGRLMMIYKLILLAGGLLHCAANVRGLYNALVSMMTSTRISFTQLFYNDPTVGFLILTFHTFFNGNNITPFLLRLTHWLQILDVHHDSFYKIRRWAWTFAVLSPIIFTIHIWNLITTLKKWNHMVFWLNFGNYYFGLYNLNPYVERVLATTFTLWYSTLTICTYLYSSLIILICLSMNCCFKKFNERLMTKKNMTYDHIQIYLHQYQRLAELVSSFNALFSPILLIMVTRCIIQTVAGYDEIKLVLKVFVPQPEDSFRRGLITFSVYAAALGFIISMTFTCGNLYIQAQQVTNVILHCRLQETHRHDSDNQALILANSHLLAVFSAHRLASPVAVTASGLYDINYNLFAMVVTSTITYATLISNN